jgi:hypothetical protein
VHWLDPFVAYAGLVAWGSHAVVPWRLARGPAARQHAWRLAAPLLLAAGVLAFALDVGLHADRAVAAGLGRLPAGSRLGLELAGCALALAAGDVAIFAARARLEAAAWRLAAGLALPALVVVTWAAELLRAGEGPLAAPPAALAAVACRALAALAAAELLAPGPPRWAPFAPLALGGYLLALPPLLTRALESQGDLLTLAAAALLLGTARWLPGRWRSIALAAGGLLAGLFFARAAALSEVLSVLVQ